MMKSETTTPQGDLKDYLSIAEVAELYGVSRPAVSQWITAGLLEAHQDGRRKLIKIDDLETFERPAAKKRGRPKGSRNKVTHLKALGSPREAEGTELKGSTKRRLEVEHGGSVDEIAEVLGTLGTALTTTATLVEKLNRETPETSRPEVLLRGDLRATRRLLRRCYDFITDAEHITLRGEDRAADLIRDIERELRGT